MLKRTLSPFKRRLSDFLYRLIEKRLEKTVDHLLKTRLIQNKHFQEHLKMKLDALELESGQLRSGKAFEDRYQLLEHAVSVAAKNPEAARGLWLEFGVNDGRSVNFIAKRAPGVVYGFDSFEGLPEDWVKGRRKVIPKGSMSQQNQLPPHEPNVRFVKGWFEETLSGFLKEHPEPVVFAHVDSDLYSSAKCVLERLSFTEGGVVVFDEYYNYPFWKDHEYKAFQEFLAAASAEAHCIGYNPSDKQVAFVLKFADRDNRITGPGPMGTG